jgi:hypothetical protein
MCEASAVKAVMGNHEFNAIGWAAQKKEGGFLRSHSAKNANQHAKFLGQLGKNSPRHKDAIGWFRTLPVWLDLPGLYRHGSVAHSAVEILLKGPEERLPAGIHFADKDGHRREEVRLRWWDQDATTFRKAALGMEGREDEIPDAESHGQGIVDRGQAVMFDLALSGRFQNTFEEAPVDARLSVSTSPPSRREIASRR